MVKIATLYLYEEIKKDDIDILNLYQTGNDEFVVRLTEKTRNKYLSKDRLYVVKTVEGRTYTINQFISLTKINKVASVIQYELTNLWS